MVAICSANICPKDKLRIAFDGYTKLAVGLNIMEEYNIQKIVNAEASQNFAVSEMHNDKPR